MAKRYSPPIVHEFARLELRIVEPRPPRRPIQSFGGSDDAQTFLRMAEKQRGRLRRPTPKR